MTEQTASTRDHRGHHRQASSGVLGADISRAVEILSVRHQILGTAAYRILSEAAERAELTVHEIARMVVREPDSLEVDIA